MKCYLSVCVSSWLASSMTQLMPRSLWSLSQLGALGAYLGAYLNVVIDG